VENEKFDPNTSLFFFGFIFFSTNKPKEENQEKTKGANICR
jgi:hypothetical protein